MIAHQQRRKITDLEYIDSIEDLFFKSVAQQTVGLGTNGSQEKNAEKRIDAASAKDQLEDLEISMRKKLLELLLALQESSDSQNANTKSPDDTTKAASDVIGAFWKSSLDLCHHFVHHACCSSSSYEDLMPCRRLPYLLLSDCLEGLPTLEDAKLFWSDYVEPELIGTVLFGDLFWSQLTEINNSKKFSLPSSHLPFLKVANQFLKRLEHASDSRVRVEWKGRIMWALSKGFSIADRSSLKLWGNFHTTNGTDFESKEEFNMHTTSTVGITASTKTNGTSAVVEYNLYEAFWSLQNGFSNPNKINVGDFIKRLRLTLAAMESASAISTGTIIPKHGVDEPTIKYLTSSALLPSQIHDPAFRSSVVTQFLIVASHLGAESPPLKNALAGLLGRARKLLKKDNPQLHDILWESILASGREDHWRTWKKQKCAASAFAPKVKRNLQLVLDSTDDDRDKKRTRLSKEEENSFSQEDVISSLSGVFLNNDNLIAVSKDLHHKLPTLEEHLEPYVEALDPESGIEDEYHPKNDSLFTWRAMRLYAKHQLPLMSQCRQPADLEKITRQWYRESHGKDIPGEMPTVEESDIINDDNKKEDPDSAEDNPAEDNQNEFSENNSTSMDVDTVEKNESTNNTDTDMKDNKMEEKEQKQVSHVNNDKEMAPVRPKVEDEAEVSSKIENPEKRDLQQNIDSTQTIKSGSEEKQSTKSKVENSAPTKESAEMAESSTDEKSSKLKRNVSKDQKQIVKNAQASKSKPAIDNGKNEEDRNKSRNNKNDSNQRQEKRPPRENNTPQNRGGGRRGNGPPQRRRGDDNYQPRGGGRSGGDSSQRGRPDGASSRGGRYDEDYRGDNSRHHGEFRGDRFAGDRSNNRSTGRDNYRGGDGGGGVGRDDNRGGGRDGNRDGRDDNRGGRSRGQPQNRRRR